jgi:hypothetical protein
MMGVGLFGGLGRGGFGVAEFVADFNFFAAEVDEQAVLDLGGFEVINQLDFMGNGEAGDRFDFEDESVFNKDVGFEIADDLAFVPDLDGMFVLDVQVEILKFKAKCADIDGFDKSVAQGRAYFEGGADGELSYLVWVQGFLRK